MKNGWSALNRQWKEKKGVTTDMPGEDVFNFVGACHLSELIKQNEYETHRDMIRDLDEVFTVSDVANKAEYYRVRLKDKSGTNVMLARNNSPRRHEKAKHGYANRGNRDNRSKSKQETDSKPGEKPEGYKKSKSKRAEEPDDDEPETQKSSVRYVEPIDWTSRSYHMTVSKSTSDAASKTPHALVHGVNGRKRVPKTGKKPSAKNKSKAGRPKFKDRSSTGEGQGIGSNRSPREWIDPYHPHTCVRCDELRADCVCDKGHVTSNPDPDLKPAKSFAITARVPETKDQSAAKSIPDGYVSLESCSVLFP